MLQALLGVQVDLGGQTLPVEVLNTNDAYSFAGIFYYLPVLQVVLMVLLYQVGLAIPTHFRNTMLTNDHPLYFRGFNLFSS